MVLLILRQTRRCKDRVKRVESPSLPFLHSNLRTLHQTGIEVPFKSCCGPVRCFKPQSQIQHSCMQGPWHFATFESLFLTQPVRKHACEASTPFQELDNAYAYDLSRVQTQQHTYAFYFSPIQWRLIVSKSKDVSLWHLRYHVCANLHI